MKTEKSKFKNLEEFAYLCHQILKSDRDCIIGCGGFKGGGKSTVMWHILKAYSSFANRRFDASCMTYDRDELLMWIDGKKKGDKLIGQKPEYSPILLDEAIDVFYRRTWFENVSSVSVMNKCRDRHLMLCTNIPNFWDLDTGFTSQIRFYIFVPNRGTAWIFEQENNPFTLDVWNTTENKKIFRKYKNPYKIPNFVTEIKFPDFDPKDKEDYYKVRNEKRKNIEKKPKQEIKYKQIKAQRDRLIRYVNNFDDNEKDKRFSLKRLAEITDLNYETIRRIKEGDL